MVREAGTVNKSAASVAYIWRLNPTKANLNLPYESRERLKSNQYSADVAK